MAIKKATKDAIAKRKAERLTDQELTKAIQAKKDRKDGNGLVSILPEGKYLLADIEQITGDFEFLQCTFINEDEKEFKISMSACLNPIYSAEGVDINQFVSFGLDNIGEEFNISHAENFGFRPVFDNDGQWTPAGDKGFKFYSESRGEYYKGRKTVVMICEL